MAHPSAGHTQTPRQDWKHECLLSPTSAQAIPKVNVITAYMVTPNGFSFHGLTPSQSSLSWAEKSLVGYTLVKLAGPALKCFCLICLCCCLCWRASPPEQRQQTGAWNLALELEAFKQDIFHHGDSIDAAFQLSATSPRAHCSRINGSTDHEAAATIYSQGIKGYWCLFQVFQDISEELLLGLKCDWTVPRCSPRIVIFLPAQLHETVPTLGTKSYFCSFLIINYDRAVTNPHGKADHLPTSCLARWQAQKLDWFRSEKRKRRSRTLHGCLTAGSWHTSNPRKGPPFQLKPVTTPALPPLQSSA